MTVSPDDGKLSVKGFVYLVGSHFI
jgi:hypothetical protein